jgi:hypothetical protein
VLYKNISNTEPEGAMKSNRRKLNLSIWLLTGVLLLPVVANAQYYDLTVGTDRHFKCFPAFGCPAIDYVDEAIESIIDEIEIDGKTYAVVVWTQWTGWPDYEVDIDESRYPVTAISDTAYYRMDESVLVEYTGGAEQSVFDYGFAKGDSLLSIMLPYLTREQIEDSYYYSPGVASVILIDTLLLFPDGISRNILWGDDTLTIGSHIYPPPVELEFLFYNNLPYLDYLYNRPFYYISGTGTILTQLNHRRRFYCGYRKPDGFHFGCYPSVITSIEEPAFTPGRLTVLQNYPNPFNPSTNVRFSLPDAGPVKLSLYDIAGKLLQVLKNETMPSGDHQMNLNMGTYASGIYMLVLEHNQSVTAHSIVLVK